MYHEFEDKLWFHPINDTIFIAPENKYSYFYKWLKRNNYICLGNV